MHRSSILPIAAVLVALFLGVAAAGPRAVAAQNTTPAGDDPIAHPTGHDEVVLRVEVGGGLLPATAFLTAIPSFSLYGDGRVVVQGPVPAIFPGPALPNLRLTRLSEEGVQAILRAARDAGLLDRDARYVNMRVADAPTTTLTVSAGDRTTVVEAYALGIAEEGAPAAEREARRELARFVEALNDLPAWLPADAILEADVPFPVERLQVIVQPVDPTRPAPAGPDADLVPDPVTWPLATPLADFGDPVTWPGLVAARCAVVEGTDAERLVAALEEANALTPWESEGTVYDLYPRPLLPDERGCAADADAATPSP